MSRWPRNLSCLAWNCRSIWVIGFKTRIQPILEDNIMESKIEAPKSISLFYYVAIKSLEFFNAFMRVMWQLICYKCIPMCDKKKSPRPYKFHYFRFWNFSLVILESVQTFFWITNSRGSCCKLIFTSHLFFICFLVR